jgi:hypothetical protein
VSDDGLGTAGARRFIQFPHPGSEHPRPAGGRRAWASWDTDHARTFLLSAGTYRSSIEGDDQRADLAFWGEWEGPAEVHADLPGGSELPTWIARPVPTWAPRDTAVAPRQNTDPFVWGPAFAYTACRQPKSPMLRGLGRGSVLLFGSVRARRFVLDTLFVVAGWIDHERLDYLDELDGTATREHFEATLHPWYGLGDEKRFRYYLGATPQNPVDGMFSFAPSRPYDGPSSGFVRPSIDLPDVVSPRNARQVRANDHLAPDRFPALWRSVAAQVLEQGCMLGTRFDLPPLEGTPPAPPAFAVALSDQGDRPARNPDWVDVPTVKLREWRDYWRSAAGKRDRRYDHAEEVVKITRELRARGVE